jgi:hypothetical protein
MEDRNTLFAWYTAVLNNTHSQYQIDNAPSIEQIKSSTSTTIQQYLNHMSCALLEKGNALTTIERESLK